MIVEKNFLFITENVNDVILEIAEEIKKGYSVVAFMPEEIRCSANTLWRPKWRVVMTNRAYHE